MDYYESVFWCTALAGTLFFILKVCFLVFGDFFDDNTDHAFKVFSIHSLTGFLMMFGWVGLACLKQFSLSEGTALLTAFIAGCFMMLITRALFKTAASLISNGSEYTLKEAIGMKGTVYQRIAEKGEGRVQVTLGGMVREFAAVAQDNREIHSFTSVEVIRVNENNKLVVKQKGY